MCSKAQRQEWGIYATNIWDNTPGPYQRPPASPQILENDELANLPDTTLEDDLQGFEAFPDTPLDLEMTPHDPEYHRPITNDAEDEGLDSANYIQEFPTHLGAGAVWGEDIPFFEKLRQEQVQNKSSRWGPFEDQDECETRQLFR